MKTMFIHPAGATMSKALENIDFNMRTQDTREDYA